MRSRLLKVVCLAGLACVPTFSGAALSACGDEENVTIEDVDEIGEDGTATPAVTFGETVTLDGEVEEVLSPEAFILGRQSGVFQEEPRVLVVTKEVVPIEESQPLKVTGTVREFVLADVEKEFGIDLDEEDEFIANLEHDAFVVAEAIEPELFDEG